MPYRTIDVSQFLENLGSQDHGLRAARIVQLPSGESMADRIHLAATGPTTFSTCTTVALRRTTTLIWDVNHYYRDLGFTWPYLDISRKDLRRAYQERQGHDSERLTYVLKQLLDPETREHYDSMPLGKRMDDQYAWDEVQRIAAQQASEETARTGVVHEAQSYVDELAPEIEAEGPDPEMVSFAASLWPYGYYLWRSRKHDDETLSEWQGMIVAACSKRGLSRQLALGYLGLTDEDWMIRDHEGQTVVFLNEKLTPTPGIAEAVASSLTPISEGNPSMTSSTTDDVEFSDDDFATGGISAADRAEAEAEARRAARASAGNRIEYFTQLFDKEGKVKSVILRFITDEPDWIEVQQHSFVPTKAAPEGKPAEASWSANWGAVCRKTTKKNGQPFYNDCYICDSMRKADGKRYSRGPRIWAIAVVRKEVLGTQEMVAAKQIQPHQVNTRVGLVDDIVEYDEMDASGNPTGRKLQRKHFVVVNMGMKNFFSQLIQYAKVYGGTILDRDYVINKTGSLKDVDYPAIPLEVINSPVKNDAGEVVGMEPFDLRNPKYASRYEDDTYNRKLLFKLIKQQMSKEHYDRYFDPRTTVKWNSRSDDDDSTSAPSDSTQSADQAPAQATASSLVSEPSGVDADMLAQMRAQVLGGNPMPGGKSDAPVTGGLMDLSNS